MTPTRSLFVPTALCAVVLQCPATPQGAPEPTFVQGEIADLSCRVVEVDELDDFARVLTIEVTNRGDADAEPLLFELAWTHKDKRREVQLAERALLPHAARYGNPTPRGGKQRYLVRTSLPFDKRGRSRGEVRVLEASFHTGGAVERPAIGFGTPEQVQRESMAGIFPVTSVKVHNPLDRALDVLVRVTMVQPLDRVELYGLHLPPAGEVDWVLMTRPYETPFVDPEVPPGTPIKATAFELVDWCLVGEPDTAVGAAMLRAAYAAWYRWPDSIREAGGEFVFHERRRRINTDDQYDDFTVRGRFQVGRDAPAKVEITAGGDADPGMLFGHAFADLVRPSFEVLQRKNRLVPVARERVAVVGPGWDNTRAGSTLSVGDRDAHPELSTDIEVRDGLVASTGIGLKFRTEWQTRDLGGRRVLARRKNQNTETTCDYRDQDGVLVPTFVTSVVDFGDSPYSISQLELQNVHFTGVEQIERPPVTGPGADALRAIWEAGYRFTGEDLQVSARFEVQNPGTDFIWNGHKKLRGRFQATGFGPNLRAAEFTFDGVQAAASQLALAAVIRDRWLIWFPRDINCRQPFDTEFAGARITGPDAAGDFTIENHRYERVRVDQGEIRGLRRSGGVDVEFAYRKFGERSVCVRIVEKFAKWTAQSDITWQSFGAHLVPVKLQFTRIFDRDWGPETITLHDVEIR